MATKKYINLNNLSTFLTVLRETFAEIGHKHSISDVTDYVVDTELSATSNNPVQNNVINTEFEAVATAMNALESVIDGKADSTHNHDNNYLTKEDPSATGSFSLNRKESTSIGTYSVAEGRNNTASGLASHAEGDGTTASARAAHAEGNTTVAKGQQSHAEGFYTVAASTSQHVQGKHNIEDANDVYAHIVGNGSSDAKSNAHTLDWDGNAWYAGAIKVGGTSYEDAVEVATKNHEHAVIIETNKNLEQKFWRGTQAEYDAIEVKDDATMYIVTDGEGGGSGGGSGGGGVGSLEELGVTATADELNYMDGVTSNVQTQLDNKANLTHVHGWSDITDKPFTEFRSDTVAWDCSTDGRAFAYLEADDIYFYKISDAIPTVSDLANGGSFRAFIEGNVIAEVPFAADMVLEIAEGVILVADTFFIIAESAVNVGLDDLDGLAFPEAGVYFPLFDAVSDAAVELTINGYTGFVTAKIKPSCLPNSILFYVSSSDSSNKYLYKDASCAEASKLTCSELKNATLSGRPMYVTVLLDAGSIGKEELYMSVTCCDFIFKNDLNYGVVVVIATRGDGEAPISSHLYTAEYTGGEVSVNG